MSTDNHARYRTYSTPCTVCGKVFLVEKCQVGKAKYCSAVCRKKGRQQSFIAKQPTYICEGCGVSFFRKGKPKFCSQLCFASWHGKQMKGESNSQYKDSIKKNCKTCGIEFEVVPALVNRKHYCSKECLRKKPKEHVHKICKICQKEFQVSKCREKSAKYCSVQCRNIGRRTIKDENAVNGKRYKHFKKECENCGKEYGVYEYQLNISRFCSRKCQGQTKSRIASAKSLPVKECANCKKLFSITYGDTNSRKFCSQRCSSVYLGKNKRGRNNSRYVEKIKTKCDTCGKETHKPLRHFKSHKKAYCSRKCANEGMKVDPIKKECPICNNDFFVIPSGKKQIYCSVICRTKANVKSTSSIEYLIKAKLEERNYFPIHQYEEGYYLIDLAFPDQKVAIECDGDYWHSFLKAKQRDKRKNTYLSNRGWQIVRLKECDIRANADECVARVIRVVEAFS